MAWEGEEHPMEMEEDKAYKEMQKSILEEVSLSFPHVENAANACASTPLSMPIQIPVPVHTSIMSGPSTFDLSKNTEKRMKTKLDELRKPVNEGEAQGTVQKNFVERFSTPASMTLPYPGLDGHQRRIKPTPISPPPPPVEKPSPQPATNQLSEFGWYWSDLIGGWFKTHKLIEAEKRAGVYHADDLIASDQTSGTNRSTIGHTDIPSEERKRIHDEIAAVMRQNFPGIHLSTVHNSEPGKSGASSAKNIESEQNSVPEAIAGSEVSIASTSNDGGNAGNFSRLSQQVGSVS